MHPSAVSGYEDAKARGWLPVTPILPPPLNVGPTAQRAIMEFVVVVFGTIAGFIGLTKLTVIPSGVFVLLSVAAFVGFALLWNRASNVEFTELGAGYVTVQHVVGVFVHDSDGRWPGENNGAGWNLNGVWYLNSKGEVVREPDWTVLPPGWYPSPHSEGVFEFWTGADWAYRYLPPPDQRTDATPKFGRFRAARKVTP